MKCALTIAATDSSNGAGIGTDLSVFKEIGVYGLSVVTNVTAQNSKGVYRINKLPTSIINAQIDVLTKDFEISACKIGMLYSPVIVSLVAERIERRNIKNVVLDPVMKAKDGRTLLTLPAVKRLKKYLMPKSYLITPNIAEAEYLTKLEIKNIDSAKDAAKALFDMGAKNVLIKGGHFLEEPIDLLYDGKEFTQFMGKRLDKNMHGTGCVLSAAIAARLALGDSLVDAVSAAKEFTCKSIMNSERLGKGGLFFRV